MTRAAVTTRPLFHLVEESASEASFLWTRLDAALDAHDYVLAEVHTWVEDRLLGALDGVRLAGVAAIDPVLRPALECEDHGAVGSSVYLLSVLSDARADQVLELGLRSIATPELASAYARGLGRAGRVDALHALYERVEDAAPQARAAVLEALAFCGHAPEVDWHTLLADQDASLRGAAARALRFAPARVLQGALEQAFYSPDRRVRNGALAAGVAAGDGASLRRCVALTHAADADAGPLLAIVAMLGAEREQGYLLDALATPGLCRDALWALGFLGTAGAAEACVQQMQLGQHEQVAAEAFCAITGLELTREGLVQTPAVDDSEPPPLADDLELALLPSADDSLPRPDVDGVSAWWLQHQARFPSGVRHVAGRRASWAALCDALDGMCTRRRHAVALELSARTGGACLLQPWAFTRVQRQQQQGFPKPSEAALGGIARGLGCARLEAT
ncbi:MAG: hypothetical protein JWN04_468 [Myxococcaceae bacterium]|nr:hypothetical protein [Myxococcaceae bacterium]